jgi:hypothetical protein
MLAARYAELTGISTICLRLGALVERSDPVLRIGNRRKNLVLTFGDAVRLFTCAVEAPAHVRHGVYCGISYRHNPRLSIAAARRELGFEPQDDPNALAWRFLFTPAGIVDLVRRGLRKAWRMMHGRDHPVGWRREDHR